MVKKQFSLSTDSGKVEASEKVDGVSREVVDPRWRHLSSL